MLIASAAELLGEAERLAAEEAAKPAEEKEAEKVGWVCVPLVCGVENHWRHAQLPVVTCAAPGSHCAGQGQGGQGGGQRCG